MFGKLRKPARMSYKNVLAATGRQPIPSYAKLRTTKAPGHLELTPRATMADRAVHKH